MKDLLQIKVAAEVHKCPNDDPSSVISTVGFSSYSMSHSGLHITLYDIGGGSQIRGIWSKYYGDVHGVIYVIDSSDFNRIGESKVVLEEMLDNSRLAGKPVLLLANKQDVPGTMDEIDIVEHLNLETLVNEKKCPTLVEICSTKMEFNGKKLPPDPRLLSGYRWLLRQIIKQYVTLNARVEDDMSADHNRNMEKRDAWRRKREEEESEKDAESIRNGGFQPVTDKAKVHAERGHRPRSGDSNKSVHLNGNGNINGMNRHTEKDDHCRKRSKRSGIFTLKKTNRVEPEAIFKGPVEPLSDFTKTQVKSPEGSKFSWAHKPDRRHSSSSEDDLVTE